MSPAKITAQTKSRSLQKTLGIGLTLGATLLWLLALLAAVLVSQHKLNALFDSALAETAQRIMPLAAIEIFNREDPKKAQHIMSFDAHDERIIYLVRDNNGAILLRSHNADPAVFNQPSGNGFSSSATHRFYAVSAIQNTLHIEVGEPLTQRREAIIEMAITLLWPLALLIPLCFIGTWAFVRYSLRQTLTYRDGIEARGGSDLSPIKVQGLPSEMLTIAESVNHLLERLRSALESERSFTANSAHELRTPIATALAQVQRLQQEIATTGCDTKITKRTIKIEAALRKLAELSEKLMQLAKAEGGSLLSAEQHDLVSLLELVVDDLKRSNSTAVLTLKLPPNQAFMSAIDPDAFAILARNLLDNAIKHGTQGESITIQFSSQGVLSIINASPVIPPATLAQLHRRFVRSNTTAEGSGLGLPIADAIVTGIGASMTFNSPATGRADGFEVRVTFPVIEA